MSDRIIRPQFLFGLIVLLAASLASAEDLVSARPPQDSLVIIESAHGSGSGFLAEIRGRRFLVTNIHVLGAARGALFTTLNGKQVTPGALAFISHRRDVAIIPVEWDGAIVEVAESLSDAGIALGDAILVMGNSDGGGVVTELKGEVTGLGPAEIEVSAKFVPGNSGSPIIHADSGKVIGVASYLKAVDKDSKWMADSELAEVRRFGFRLDGAIEWRQVPIERLFEENDRYQSYVDRTIAIGAMAHYMIEEQTILTGYKDHDSLGYLLDGFDSNFKFFRGTASSSNRRQLEQFALGLQNELQRDASVLEEVGVNYYRQLLNDYQAFRKMTARKLANYRP